MRLEMGRHYRAEDGTKRGPMDSRWDLDLFWEKGQTGPKEPGWNRDGSVNDRYPNPHGALIAEWQDLTQITTSFGLLDEETQKALKAHEGGIEYYCSDGTWIVLGFPIWDKGKTYRAKPEPKRETFTGECRAMVFQRRCPTLTDEGTQGQPGKYTAEVVDGDITRIVWEASE